MERLGPEVYWNRKEASTVFRAVNDIWQENQKFAEFCEGKEGRDQSWQMVSFQMKTPFYFIPLTDYNHLPSANSTLVLERPIGSGFPHVSEVVKAVIPTRDLLQRSITLHRATNGELIFSKSLAQLDNGCHLQDLAVERLDVGMIETLLLKFKDWRIHS